MKNTAAKNSTPALIGQATPEQIAAWKAANTEGIYGLKIQGHSCYLKYPNRDEINCAYTKASREASLEMYEELAQLTWLGGSEEVLKNTQLFLGLRNHLRDVIDGPQAEILDL